jgi:hypothetical protein
MLYGKGEDDMLDTLIPEKYSSLSIGHLHLPRRAYNALSRSNILTIGDLLIAYNDDLDQINGIGSNADIIILNRLQGIINAIKDDTIDWFSFWNNQDIMVVPADILGDISQNDIFSKIIDIIKDILNQDGDEKSWRIIERRFGLNKKEKLTLDEIGRAFDLTRERVRQIENKSLLELRSVLLLDQYINKSYHVHPIVTSSIKSFFDKLVSRYTDLVIEYNILDTAREVWDIKESDKPLLILLLVMAEMNKIEFNNTDIIPIWELSSSSQTKLVANIIAEIDNILTRKIARPIDEFDLLVAINTHLGKGQRISQIQLRRFINLCSTVEQREDGLYQGKFTFLKGRMNQAERVLLDEGNVLTSSEISRRINMNLRMFSFPKLNSQNLSNQMLADNRFVSIGRSGWALKSWSHITSENIIELMEKFLIEKSRPATIDEIYNSVADKRPVKKTSISIYLSQSDLFYRVDRKHWSLTSWSLVNSSEKWDHHRVSDFIINLFKKRKVKEIELSTLRELLSEASNMTLNQSQGMINVNPVIKTRREDYKHIYAVLQSDHKENVSKNGIKLKTRPRILEDKLKNDIQSILDRSQGYQLELSKLVEKLLDLKIYKKPTIYAYIDKSDIIEKYTNPENRVVFCRLKHHISSQFPQAINITDPLIKAEVGRAIENFTMNNVDIGLFLLGRQFEVVIKRALLKGIQKSAIVLPTNIPSDPLKWKLSHMVDAAKQCGLITDLGVVNLLRQERNDRAHGDTPSLDERQIMLNNIQYLAGLYIEYIILFSKYEQSWT